MRTVALISPYHQGGFGIRAIHSYLKTKGIKTALIFLSLNNRRELTQKEGNLLIQLLKNLNSYLIGLIVYAPSFQAATYLTRLIRQELNVPIIWGGVHPTLCPDECLKEADLICLGEGEEALFELVEAINKKEDITSIFNLWGRTGDKIWKNPLRPLLTDIDKLPFIDIGTEDKYILNKKGLFPGDPIRIRNRYIVRASRGCPFSCGYCANKALREKSLYKKNYFRRRSPENIIQEIKRAVQEIENIKLIKIDEVLPITSDPWLDELVQRYQKEIGLPLELELYPGSFNYFDSKALSLLIQGGLKQVIIGIESGSEEIRTQVFGRKGKNEEILEITKYLQKQGIELKYNFILDNPFENEDDRRKTFELILNLPRPYRLNLYNTQFYPEIKITKIALEKGLIKPHDVEGKHRLQPLKWRSIIDQFCFDKDKYYACLTILASIRFFPRLFLRVLHRMKLFHNNTAPLILFIRGLSTILKRYKLDL